MGQRADANPHRLTAPNWITTSSCRHAASAEFATTSAASAQTSKIVPAGSRPGEELLKWPIRTSGVVPCLFRCGGVPPRSGRHPPGRVCPDDQVRSQRPSYDDARPCSGTRVSRSAAGRQLANECPVLATPYSTSGRGTAARTRRVSRTGRAPFAVVREEFILVGFAS